LRSYLLVTIDEEEPTRALGLPNQASDERMATNILASRLVHLEQRGGSVFLGPGSVVEQLGMVK
jgi:hypothetical protein